MPVQQTINRLLYKEKGSFIGKCRNVLFAGKPLKIHYYSKISHIYNGDKRKVERDHSPTYTGGDQPETETQLILYKLWLFIQNYEN